MTIKLAINGFGRIGRLVLRAIAEKKRTDVQVVAINDLSSVEQRAHLFQFDSIHGTYPYPVKISGDSLDIGTGSIKTLSQSDPQHLPWSDLDVDVLLECSGRFTEKAKAHQHIVAGAKKVLISAPSPDADLTVVYGVNHAQINSEHLIVSNASCTTNCLAPVAYALHNDIGIEHGFMTTIHAYTGDQSLVDTYHKDLRRSRSSALSMIPTSTGAAKAVGLVLPDLKGKLDGTAIRVPTPNVSVVDLKFTSRRKTSLEEINTVLETYATGSLKGILGICKAPLVSCDFNHSPLSSIADMTQTQVIEETFCRVLSWYDNEWGFSNRMIDTAVAMANA